MKSAALKFILLSIGLHALGFSVMWERDAFEGNASGNKSFSSELAPMVFAGFASEKNLHGADVILEQSQEHEKLEDRLSNSPAEPGPTAISHANEVDAASNPRATPLDEYVTAGKLTRLPAPATSIDLDVPEVKEVAGEGFVQLTILIDTDGAVVDVLGVDKNSASREFSERVAEIFKRARFVPGEVNGKAVKALLEINVVSEDLRLL